MKVKLFISLIKPTFHSHELAARSYESGRFLPLLGFIATIVCSIVFSPSMGHQHLTEWTTLTAALYLASHFLVFSRRSKPKKDNPLIWQIRHTVFLLLSATCWSTFSLLTIHHVTGWEELTFLFVIFALIAIPAPTFIYNPLIMAANPALIFISAVSEFYLEHQGEQNDLLLATALLLSGTVYILKNIDLSIETTTRILQIEASKTPVTSSQSERKNVRDPLTSLLNGEGLISSFDNHKSKRTTAIFCSIKLLEAEELYFSKTKNEANLIIYKIVYFIEQRLAPEFLVGHDGVGQLYAIGSTSYDIVSKSQIAMEKLGSLQASIDEEFGELQYRAAIGVASYPSDSDDPEELFFLASTAMRQSAVNTKNAVTVYNKDIRATTSRSRILKNRLPLALEKRELEIYLQPKVSLSSGQTTGAEALLRWNTQELGFISPAEFIPIAESTGFIRKIGQWVLNEATQILSEGSFGEVSSIAINVSALQLDDQDFIDQLSNTKEKLTILKKNIELEITESLLISDINITEKFLSTAEELGFELSLDDFGTGYSSLSYLTNFRAHKIKLDKSFIDEIPHNEKQASLVRSVIALAKTLDMKIVAEGIERQGQLQWLKDAGCDEGQGYLLCKPVPVNEFIAWVRNNSIV